jgi:hypothetical protein
MRVAYNNGDVALRFMAHEYFDLHGEQTDHLKVQLVRLHTWHRREELPQYAVIFGSAAERLGRGLTREDVVWAIAAVRTRYRVTMEQGADEFAPVAATFRPDNLEALERKLADNNEQFTKEFLSGDAAKQTRARAKRLMNWFDDWLGSVTPEQEGLIDRFAQAQPQMNRIRLDDRKRRQQEFVQLLREHRKSPDLAARMRDYFVNWERERGAEHRRMAREWEDRLVTLIIDVDRTLTPAASRCGGSFFAQEGRIRASRAGRPTTAAARGRGVPGAMRLARFAGRSSRGGHAARWAKGSSPGKTREPLELRIYRARPGSRQKRSWWWLLGDVVDPCREDKSMQRLRSAWRRAVRSPSTSPRQSQVRRFCRRCPWASRS